ncbi:MAG: hypothetical protein K0U76_04575 [Actinomycetia bacterium]|nr:hypothetical protein [Actinomycetes bacterium]MCH9700652.1 hypothetical protein [Actinomycetes bacterium]MCH9761930.1 hypothetical protein [Actinomycetes bacterium]
MWWFYTVILGIAFGQLISQLAVAVRDWCWEPQRRPFVPAMLWQIFLLVLVIEVWLASTYYRQTVTQTTILELVAYLVVPAGILVMSVLLPPSKPVVETDGLSPSVAFARVRPIFFGVLIFFIAVNVLHEILIGELSRDLDLLFQGLIVAGGVAGLFLRKTAADIALAILMIALVIAYIGMGYATVVVDDMV